jgi:hypothetical protein
MPSHSRLSLSIPMSICKSFTNSNGRDQGSRLPPSVDLSEQKRLNRAVVIGAPSPNGDPYNKSLLDFVSVFSFHMLTSSFKNSRMLNLSLCPGLQRVAECHLRLIVLVIQKSILTQMPLPLDRSADKAHSSTILFMGSQKLKIPNFSLLLLPREPVSLLRNKNLIFHHRPLLQAKTACITPDGVEYHQLGVRYLKLDQ